jgi:hypothetical protein
MTLNSRSGDMAVIRIANNIEQEPQQDGSDSAVHHDPCGRKTRRRGDPPGVGEAEAPAYRPTRSGLAAIRKGEARMDRYRRKDGIKAARQVPR